MEISDQRGKIFYEVIAVMEAARHSGVLAPVITKEGRNARAIKS